MISEQARLAAAGIAVIAALSIGVACKVRAIHRSAPAGRLHPLTFAPLAPGNAAVALSTPPAPGKNPAKSSPAIRPADPNAAVHQGPPRMYHLDPARTNRSPYRGVNNPAVTPIASLDSPIQTAPAVLSDGTVVVATLGGDVVGVRGDGSVAFKTNLGARIYASPLIVRDRIYLGADNKRFVSLSTSGKLQWSLATEGDADTAAAPTSAGLVFASDDTLFALRANATVLWRVQAKRKLYSSPAVGPDGSVYVGSQDHRLYGISSQGKVRFSANLGADVDCAPSVDADKQVVVGTDGGKVVALHPASGTVLWKTPVGGHVRGGVTITRSHDVVAGVYGPSPRVVRIDGATGAIIWSFPLPSTGAREYGVHGSPVEDADQNLTFGSQDDAVYSLRADGQLRWKVAVGADVDAAVVLASDGVVIAACDDGKLYRIAEQVPEKLQEQPPEREKEQNAP